MIVVLQNLITSCKVQIKTNKRGELFMPNDNFNVE